jgi:hypothetical protein
MITINKYSKKFARSQWRKSFAGSNVMWQNTRQAGATNSFRTFTGRCKS